MSLRGTLGPGLVAAVCLGAVGWSRWVAPPVVPTDPERHAVVAAGPEARALLGDLREGERLVGWTVEAITGPTDGELRIELGRDGVRFSLMVTRRAGATHAAPLTTERYAIFYGHAVPPDVQLPAATTKATSHALARRIRAHEATVAVPGL